MSDESILKTTLATIDWKSAYERLLEENEVLKEKVADLEQQSRQQKEENRRVQVRADDLTLKLIKAEAKIKALKNDLKKVKTEKQKLQEAYDHLASVHRNNSRNTSKPPSTDAPHSKAHPYNSRRATGRRPGGVPKHRGITLTKEKAKSLLEKPNTVHKVEIIGDEKSGASYVTKYKIDIREDVVVTEFRIYADANGTLNIPSELKSDVIYGDNLKARIAYLYAEGRMGIKGICDYITMATEDKLQLSTGTVYNFLNAFAQNARKILEQLEEESIHEKIMKTDATFIRMNGKQAYIRNITTKQTALFYPMTSKSVEALKQIGPLTAFVGVLAHDHERAVYNLNAGSHAECNAHTLRYLLKTTEEAKNSWAVQMGDLLMEIYEETKKHGGLIPDLDDRAAYENRYLEIIHAGMEQNRHTKSKSAAKFEKRLLRRLKKFAPEHLLFMTDSEIPFDNNESERMLRGPKKKAKNAGGFRTKQGVGIICSILSIVETCKKRKLPILKKLREVFSAGGAEILLPAP